jgi:predicted nucleic acid-binding protein
VIDLPGLLDTNVFIHAHTHDNVSKECREFLAALEVGAVRAVLEPVILHELSYALPYYLKQITREGIAEYLLMILSWEGVLGPKETLIDTVERWRRTLASHSSTPT